MWHTFFSTVYNVFLPISIPVLIGACIRRYRSIDTKPLSTLALYMLSPALIFETLLKAQLSMDDVSYTAAFSLLNLLAMWLAASGMGRMLRLNSAEQSGLTLVSIFTNSVNYGLPLVLLAFGQLGLDKASVYVIMQMVIVNTLGVFFAARSQFSIKQAAHSILKLPSIYAAALAVCIRVSGLDLPIGLDKGITMISNAYAPIVLAILGAQMVNAKSATGADGGTRKIVWAGIAARLILSPLIAWLILYGLQIKGVLFGVLLTLASMPAAVNAVLLAEQFDASPRIVSRCILWATLASFIVLPVLIMLVS